MSTDTELQIRFTGEDERPSLPVVAMPTSGGSLPAALPSTRSAVQTGVSAPAVGGSVSPSSAALPAFEGAPVAKSEIKVSGVVLVDTREGITVGMDDRLRICGDFRVVRVSHYVNKEGEVVRQQVLAPCDELDLVPWDATNPNDNGIIRAR